MLGMVKVKRSVGGGVGDMGPIKRRTASDFSDASSMLRTDQPGADQVSIST